MFSYAHLRDLLNFLVLRSMYKEFSEQHIITYLLFAAQRGIQLNVKIYESLNATRNLFLSLCFWELIR